MAKIIKTKKSLMDYFGILSDKEGYSMLKNLERIRVMNIRLLKEKLKRGY